jgi:antitoxin (DNA-binding transcriptional repressor) of toxin-antitoxin stability system
MGGGVSPPVAIDNIMWKVKLEEAQRRLPELIEEAARGEDVVISRGDSASFRLVPVVEPEPRPIFGSARGQVEMADDFDAPVEGFEPYT